MRMIPFSFWNNENVVVGFPIVTDQLSMYLTAGNSTSYPGSGTIWNDISAGNDNDAFILGPSFSSSNGGQFSFNGSSNYADVSNHSTLNPTAQITLSMWLSCANDSGFRGAVMKTTDFNWNNGYGIFTNNGFVTFFINLYNGAHVVTVYLGTFTMCNLVGVYDGTNLKLYQNGSLIGTGSSYSTPISNSSGKLDIGRGSGASGYWSGIISEVALWRKGLSGTEVLNNFNNTKSRFGL